MMNKKLKLINLASPRYTRSMKKKPGEFSDTVSNTSKYFHDNDKQQEEKVIKRKPISIKYEDTPNIKPDAAIKAELEDVPSTKALLSIKVEYEDLPDVQSAADIENVPEIDKNVKVEKPIKSEKNWEPINWKTMLSNIQEMRKYQTAPVDEMGCHRCADPTASETEIRFQALVALMLSSQTKDQVTFAAMERLKAHGCTPTNIMNTPDDVLGKLIHPVGFWRRKVEYLKKTAAILQEKYNGDIPRTINGLCSLPGVGPKMGHICMQVAWGEISGIGVDTHVHRICNRLGWVKSPTKTPEATRIQLESWLPKENWTDINHILVGFGQEICLPLRPNCKECLNKNICPFAKKNRVK